MEKIEQILKELEEFSVDPEVNQSHKKSIVEHLYYKFASLQPQISSTLSHFFYSKIHQAQRDSLIQSIPKSLPNLYAKSQPRLPALTKSTMESTHSSTMSDNHRNNNPLSAESLMQLSRSNMQTRLAEENRANPLPRNSWRKKIHKPSCSSTRYGSSTLIQKMNRSLGNGGFLKQLQESILSDSSNQNSVHKEVKDKHKKAEFCQPEGSPSKQPVAAKPKIKHLYKFHKGLEKQQRYTTVLKPVDHSSLDYTRGIYDLSNMFKQHNLSLNYLKEAEPKAIQNRIFTNSNMFRSRLEDKLISSLALAKSSKQSRIMKDYAHNIFLTRIHADVIKEENSERDSLKPVDTAVPREPTRSHKSNKSKSHSISQPAPSSPKYSKTKKGYLIEQNLIIFEEKSFFKVVDYKIIETPQYQLFKLQHKPSSGRLANFMNYFIKYLQDNNLRSVTITANEVLATDCVNKRVQESDFVRCIVNKEIISSLRRQQRINRFRKDWQLAASCIQLVWRAKQAMIKLKKK